MGIFRRMKNCVTTLRDLKKLAAEAEECRPTADKLTTAEMKALPDDVLLETVWERVEKRLADYEEPEERLRALNEPQRVVWVLWMLDMEVNNGGLCQFFVNSSRAAASWVSDCMALVGADEHRQLYDDFVARNQLDLTDLSSFDVRRVSDYKKQCQRLPFDEYDEHFYRLEPLEMYLKPYIRAHLEEL